MVIVEVGGKLIEKPLNSFFSEHQRVHPYGNIFRIPAGNYGGSRISVNFNHQSWVPRGSTPVRVRFTVHGVNDEIRDGIRVHMKADKQARKDRDRGPGDYNLYDGAEFDLAYGTDGERAYYFVERDSPFTGEHLPTGAYFQLERID